MDTISSANARRVSVAIVGGGPVGLGLAIELGQRGVDCLLVERRQQPQPVPKGQNLTQRTMEHFHFWGAEAELRAARTIPKAYGIGGVTAYGSLLGGYSYDWLQRELVRPYYFTDNERLPQYATEAVLRRRLAQLPNVTTFYGWAAEAVTQDGEAARLQAVRRADGERMDVVADYAVGCDGSRSLVRQAAGIGELRSDHDRTMVLLVFRSVELHRLLERFPGKSYYNVLQPELDGYWKFFGRVDLGSTWFFHAPAPPGATRDNFDFVPYIQEAVGQRFAAEIDYVGFWDLRFSVAESYRSGRLFIAGDAAHSHPPYGGYGINTGLEDAVNLGWKLAADLQGWAGPALLDSYSAERQPVFASTSADFIEKSISTDREFLRTFGPDKDLAAFERAWKGRAQGAVSEVGSFAPHYDGSPVVCGDPAAVPSALGRHSFVAEAGRHLAPATMSDGSNVYERLGRDFTLLAFGADPALADRFSASAAALRLPLAVVSDAGTDEIARYGAPLVLVRPDQFVAWAGEGCEPADVLRRAIGRS